MNDRELDAAVAEALFGYDQKHFEAKGLPEKWINLVPNYSTDHNAAMEVTLKAIELLGWPTYASALMSVAEWSLLAIRQWAQYVQEDDDAPLREGEWNSSFEGYRIFHLATPRQRCEAALKCAKEGK